MVIVEPIVSSSSSVAAGVDRKPGTLLRLQSTVAEILAEARSESEACSRLLCEVCRALDFRWGACWMRRSGRLELIERFCADDPELQEFDELSKTVHFVEGEGVPGRVWAERGPLWIEDCVTDPKVHRRRVAARCNLRSALGIPISGREFHGVLEFFNPHIPAPPPDVLQLFLALGSQLGQFLERRRAERALADSQSLFQAVFQNCREAILLADDEGRHIEANSAALKLLGLTHSEFLTRRIWEVIPAHDGDSGRKQWQNFLERREQEGEFQFSRLDGNIVTVEYRASASIVPGVHLWIFRDVTERKQKDQRTRLLAEAGVILAEGLDFKLTLKRVARLAAPAFADWCVVDLVNDEGQIQRLEMAHINPDMEAKAWEMERRFPIDPARAHGAPNVIRTGRTEFITITEEMLRVATRSSEHYHLAREFGLTGAIVVALKVQNKVFGALSFIRCRPRPAFSASDIELAEELGRRASWAIDNARHFAAAQTELELREKVETALKDLNHELERRIEERTAALKESHSQLEAFCYSVSHDLRAPLRSMQGFSHALIEDHSQNLNEEGCDFARRILAASEHMDGLLADVLAYSRLSRQELKPESVEIASVVRDVLIQLQSEIRAKNPVIKTEACRGKVLAHASVLELMLVNLLDNALKFVHKGVTPEVTISVEIRKDRRRICIRDNGIGVPPEHQQRIFRIFERLHGVENYPGTGIGLALVQKAAERMNGAVGVDSAAGQGSSFWIDLPAVEAAPCAR
jgi:PAS domain S-box-containing protein